MFFLGLMAALAALAWFAQLARTRRSNWRTPLRHGMAAAFMITGIDHFISLESRYLPMIPPYLEAMGTELVILSGLAEIAGGIGLLIPLRVWTRFGLPNLRPVAGLGLALLLSVMVLANAHVAEAGLQVEGLAAGREYASIRPLLQPLMILWALVCSEAVFPSTPAAARPGRPSRAAQVLE